MRMVVVLPGAVGPEEPVHAADGDPQVQSVDGDLAAAAVRYVLRRSRVTTA